MMVFPWRGTREGLDKGVNSKSGPAKAGSNDGTPLSDKGLERIRIHKEGEHP